MSANNENRTSEPQKFRTSELLLMWGARLKCGKEVFGEQEKKTFREFSQGRDDITDLWVQFPGLLRAYAISELPKFPTSQLPGFRGFEFRVRKAMEYGADGISLEPMYWVLITKYQDHKIVKKVKTNGEFTVENIGLI